MSLLESDLLRFVQEHAWLKEKVLSLGISVLAHVRLIQR